MRRGGRPPTSETTLSIDRSELQGRAVRGSLVTSLHILIATPSAVAANAVLARLLHPAGYGSLAYLSIAFAIAASITEFGVPWALMQWGAAAAARGEHTDARTLLSRLVGFKLAVQAPLLAVFGTWLLRGQSYAVMSSYFAIVILTAGLSGATLALVVQNRTASIARIAIVANVLLQGSVVVAALTMRAPVSVWLVRMAISLAVPIFALLALSRPYRRAVLTPRWPTRMPTGFWRFALSMGLAGLLTSLVMTRTEVFVLRFYGQNTNLGLFALAFGLSQWLTGPVDSMLGPLMPASAALVAAHPAHTRRALLRALRFSSVLSGGLNACLVPAIYFLLPFVYSGQYSEAAILFLPLGILSTFQSVWNPANALLVARRRGTIQIVFAGSALVLDLGIALLAIPRMGAWGAVLANATAQIAWILMFAISESRAQQIGLIHAVQVTWAWPMSVLALGVGVLVGVVPIWRGSWFAGVVGAAAGLTAYVVLVRLLGGVFDTRDTAALLSSLPDRLKRPAAVAVGLISKRVRSEPAS